MIELPFAKLQAAGNGYVVIDGRELALDWSVLARRITDSHFGVGSDGIAVVQRSQLAPVCMRIFNSDGSEAEMSGNGIRLFAKFVLDRGLAPLEGGALEVETGGGLRRVFPTFEAGRVVAARVEMDEPRFELAALPADPAHAGGAQRLVDFALDVGGRQVVFTGLSLGNPHAVILTEEEPADFALAEVATALQAHPLFPQRVNVEVARVVARDRLRARVYERGEGETLASGTGATACAVAARLCDRTDARVEVELPGGVLLVAWSGPGASAWLTGPAVEVFDGVWREPLEVGS
ncbi:MAG: diaminopimelate epimerase [Myxococcota bacterium]|nr:diaminopimelate epimerase [Myxococcota bacterium]